MFTSLKEMCSYLFTFQVNLFCYQTSTPNEMTKCWAKKIRFVLCSCQRKCVTRRRLWDGGDLGFNKERKQTQPCVFRDGHTVADRCSWPKRLHRPQEVSYMVSVKWNPQKNPCASTGLQRIDCKQIDGRFSAKCPLLLLF